MPNHKNSSAKRVPNGTAPDEPLPHTKKFKMKNTTNTTPGKRKAVCTGGCQTHCNDQDGTATQEKKGHAATGLSIAAGHKQDRWKALP